MGSINVAGNVIVWLSLSMAVEFNEVREVILLTFDRRHDAGKVILYNIYL